MFNVYKIRETKPNNQDFIITMNNLAEIYRINKKYPDSFKLFKQSLKLNLRIFGKNNNYFVISLRNLALLHLENNEIVRAWSCLMYISKLENKTIDEIFSIASERQRLIYLNKILNTFYFYISFILKYYGISEKHIRFLLCLQITK